MKDKKVVINMFSGFTITANGKTLKYNDIKSERLIKLFTYLIFEDHRVVHSQELIDLMWYYEEVDNPIGALKNLVYRLRVILKKHLGIDDLILTGKSSYYVNSEYQVEGDFLRFEEINILLNDDPNNMELYDELVHLYNGKFLPMLDSDTSVIAKARYFHVTYISRVIEYCRLLEKNENYKKEEVIASDVFKIDELEERINCYYIRALFFQKQYAKARAHYKRTINAIFKTLGTRPSDYMQELYQLICNEDHIQEGSIDDIQDELNEQASEGAFLCPYGSFKDLYQMQARLIDRLGVSSHLCLVSVDDNSKFETDKENNKNYIEKIMTKVEESLVSGLRVGDVVSRYSQNQFIILLPTCTYEDSLMVMNRVLRKINQSLNNKNVSLSFSVQEVNIEVFE